MPKANNKLIQKDITFDIDLTCSIFNASRVFKQFQKNYKVESIKKSWSIRKPLKISAIVRVNLSHSVNIDKMRQKQHEIMATGFKRKNEGDADE